MILREVHTCFDASPRQDAGDAKAQQKPFLSQFVAKPTRNFTEMMFALAVIDLPFKAGCASALHLQC